VRAFRVPLESGLRPEEAVAWLRGEDRPFALVGEWLGGLTVLGSHPARVAGLSDDPFALIEDQPRVDGGDAVVGGGWVGWLGYGLGARIEQLPPSPPAPIPCPSFSLAFYDHVVLYDGERWWFEGLLGGERDAVVRERLDVWASRLARVPAPISRDAPTPFVLAANGGAGHVDAVADCRRRIEAGELYQANLCVRLEARYDGDALDLFARALPRAQPRFGALVGGVVSLSPERFLRRSGRDVWTEPIKGTRPRTGFPDEDSAAREALLASTKDAAEHVMIVDLMRNDIGRVCAYGSVQAQAPRIEGHAGVWHLVSTVSGRLRDGVRDGELLRATFPPGSVTGAPKVQAMKVIATLEATRREVYTGAIGIASPIAGLDTSVVIRTFETAGDAIWIGAGGAIVADSDPEQELSEALTKAAGPVAAIGGSLARPRERPPHPPELCVHPGRAVERALLYGRRPDPAIGVFDTMLVEDGRPVAPELHLQRLAASVSQVYGATLPRTLAAGVQATAAEAAGADGRARLRIDVDVDGDAGVRVRITLSPAGPPPPGAAVLEPYALPGGLGAHKWRDRRLLDALTALRPGTVPLLVDTDGLVLEAAYANVWIAEGDELVTPPADGRILPGTVRATLLASEPGAREEPIELERLASAESIFLTSSISVRRPARLRRQVLVPVPVAALL
jgi:anthranilate/para-aminobenzoate synthase component I/branched-subunit amino acid aminotransferase/4-amino-4-deoxychorismate lyase